LMTSMAPFWPQRAGNASALADGRREGCGRATPRRGTDVKGFSCSNRSGNPVLTPHAACPRFALTNGRHRHSSYAVRRVSMMTRTADSSSSRRVMPSAGQVKYRRRGIVIDDDRERLDFEPHQSSRLNGDRHMPLIKSPIGAREVLRRPRTAPQQIGADWVPREAADRKPSPTSPRGSIGRGGRREPSCGQRSLWVILKLGFSGVFWERCAARKPAICFCVAATAARRAAHESRARLVMSGWQCHNHPPAVAWRAALSVME